MSQIKGDLSLLSKVQVRKPSMYMVIMHNDEVTTQDFVVRVLKFVFNKEASQATDIMMRVHKQGHAVVGVYPYDIARTKVLQVEQMARLEKFPLQCSYRKAD